MSQQQQQQQLVYEKVVEAGQDFRVSEFAGNNSLSRSEIWEDNWFRRKNPGRVREGDESSRRE